MPKKTFPFIIIFFLFVLPLFSSAAQIVSISLDRQILKPNEKIEASVSFTNPTQNQLKGQLICNFTDLNRKFPPMPSVEEFDLAPGQKSKAFNFEMTVGKLMPEGLWRVEVEVRDENNNLITESYKEFKVIGTKKPIEANVNICADRSCSERKAVFVENETAYIKLDSPLTDLDISSTIKDPSGKIENIIFENNLAVYSLKNADEGSYSLWINLSKEGYLNQKIERNFAVLNAPAEIQSVSICNADGKCEGEENKQNCPQDCLSGTKNKNSKFYIFVVAVLLIIGAGVMMFIIKKKKKGL